MTDTQRTDTQRTDTEFDERQFDESRVKERQSDGTQGSTVVEHLRNALEGEVIGPADPEYESARRVFNGLIDRRPAVIAKPTSAAEVARVLAVAQRTGLELTVRGGAHSGLGFGVADDGIVLDTAALRELEIDVPGRTAWAGAGLTAGEYTAAAAVHGLATGFGDAGSVGIAGLTLGGGVGFLSRKHGLTIDSLLAVEIVTADGEVLHVDEEQHPDLFWAIRGGGGNFGVVTRLRFRLHEVASVTGGYLVLQPDPDVLAGFVAAAKAAPDELSTIVNVMHAPPAPFIPADLHGQVLILAAVCHVGSPEEGTKALEPFRRLAEPVADLIQAGPYTNLFPPTDPDFHPGAVIRTTYIEEFTPQLAADVIDRVAGADAPIRLVQLRTLGGAIARVAPDATAYAHRDAQILASAGAMFDPGAVGPEITAWVDETARLLGGEGAYVNFLEDESPDGVRAAYPGDTWERLREIKGRYDPANLFRGNHNVQPA